MTDFDIPARIRALLDGTDLPGPNEVAEVILADLRSAKRDELLSVIAQVLPTYVSTVMTSNRSYPAPASTTGRATQSRAQRVAEWWQAELHQRYRGVNGWAMLGDFTSDDHAYAANERRGRAATLVANADWHEQCAKAMRAARAKTMKALPPSVIADLLAARRPE